MKKFKFTSATKGFTLIELLVVIAIIGILGAIVYAPFQTARRKGRDAQKIVEMKNLASSLALYADDHNGEYPVDMAALQSAMSDKLPSNVNKDTSYDLTKYNYTSYTAGGRVIGYHLYTHLETKSLALPGAAGCYGSADTGVNSTSTCVVASSSVTPGGVTPEPTDGNQAFFTDHTEDSDSLCPTDLTKCIFDLKS